MYSLVMALARSRHGIPAVRLASELGLRVRTVYRDLAALQKAGFPVTQGEGARWKLMEGWQDRVPFPIPVQQLLALHVARNLMVRLRGTPATRDFEELWGRLAGIRPGNGSQGELFPRFRAAVAMRSHLAIDYSEHEAVLETLCQGCEAQRTVRVIYDTAGHGKNTRRKIDPYSLYYDPELETLYVFAWCHLRRGVRTFAVHRFRQASLTTQQFERPGDFTAEKHLRGAFRVWRGENVVHVRLLVDKEIAGWVTGRKWHASQKSRRRSDRAAELDFWVDGVQEIRRFILQLGAEAEVLEPAWLRDDIAREHERAAKRQRRAEKTLTPDDTVLAEDRRA